MHAIHEHATGNQVPAYHKGEFFAQLSPSALRAFDALLFPSSYPAHTLIFSEEQPAAGIAVVLEGEVRLSISSSDGRRLSFCIARAGEVLGLTAAMSGRPYEMTAEAMYPAKIAHVSRQTLLHFLASHPEAYQAVTRDMIHSFNLACEQLRTVGLSASAPERLARLLLGWSESGEKSDAPARCRLSLTHEEIGEFIGASRETVTRTLTVFKNRRLVAVHGSTLTIPSRDALQNVARG